MPKDLSTTPDTVSQAVETGIDYMIASEINAPIAEFYQEGLRHPEYARINGKDTDVVIIPVSDPTSSMLRQEYDVEAVASTWNSVIESTVNNHDLCVFLLKASQAGKPEYIDAVFRTIDNAASRGMSFTSPSAVASHYRLMDNVSLMASIKVDSATITLNNSNNAEVRGAAFHLTLPAIDFECKYTAGNGRIENITKTMSGCDVYISTDLKPFESKTVIIEPSVVRRQMTARLLKDPAEGIIKIRVEDSNRKPVEGAVVSIGDRRLKTDQNGTISIYLNRNTYPVTIEKEGFIRVSYNLEVRGRIYQLLDLIPKKPI